MPEIPQDRFAQIQSLLDQEANLQSFIRNSNDGIIIIDQQGKIAFINLAGRRLFGFNDDDPAKVNGRNIREFMPERYREAHSAGLKRMRETGESHLAGKTVALNALRKDGREVAIEISISRLAGRSKPMFYAILREAGKLPDITL